MNAARTLVIVLFLVGLISLFSIGSTVVVSEQPQGPTVREQLEEVSLTASSVYVFDRTHDRVLLEREEDSVRPIASIVKLFTAHVANTSAVIDQDALIEWQDFSTEGNAGALWLGEEYTVRELLFPLLLSSSNDAGTAVYRAIGHNTFYGALELLYQRAELTDTQITDPTGLYATNKSTARELAQFLDYLETEDPYILDITAVSSHVGNYRGWINNSPARTYDSFRGGKHGYIPEAGRTFAGLFETDAAKYIVVLLGSDDIAPDLEKIIAVLP